MVTVLETTTTPQPTVSETYRIALQDVTTHAKAQLPVPLHKRLASAYEIAASGGVVMHGDDVASVASRTTAGRYYKVNGVCQCVDASHAPQGLCAHRLARGLVRRATQVAAARIANGNAPVTPEHSVTSDAVEVIAPATPETPSTPLYESPASANAFILVAGHKVQLTVRGHDERDVLARMAKVLAQYPAA